ncbi:MAG TPA: hypothetical protein VJT09_18900 [Pyrinomonadaceae bacterium]|nr:hypothetical protein [Pyrinomonadaceae bacterium]
MNYPKDSHPQAETVEEVVQTEDLSPRQKGVRQGVKLMLLSVVLIPAYVLLAALFPAQDQLIESHVSDTAFEKISEAILFTIFLCGLARILYAYLFARAGNNSAEQEERGARLDTTSTRYALPPSQSIPVSGFGAWRRDTAEVAQTPADDDRNKESL